MGRDRETKRVNADSHHLHTTRVYNVIHIFLTIKTMSGKKGGQRQMSKKEEEALIKMFSRDVGSKGNASFLVNALLAAATPLFLYIRVQQVDLSSAWHVMAVLTCVTAYVLQSTYGKAKFGLKQKMATSIHEGIVKEVNNSLSEADKKKMSAQQKDDRIIRRKNEIAD